MKFKTCFNATIYLIILLTGLTILYSDNIGYWKYLGIYAPIMLGLLFEFEKQPEVEK